MDPLCRQAGANIEAVDRLLEKPLHAAAESGRIDCVQLLLEHGADVNQPQAGNGWDLGPVAG